MKYAFIFVCQGGGLEAKACLLAASLRGCVFAEHELIAAVPGPASTWRQPRPATLACLRALGVRVVEIRNPVSDDYPIGNKVACFDVPTRADVRVFVDSDVLCMAAFDHDTFFETPFCAKPADHYTFGATEAVWRHIYACEGLEMPTHRMRSTVFGDEMPPYFNAGFIAVHSGSDFGGTWADICRRVDADPAVQNKRPWLDQVALPVAAAKLGLAFRALPDEYNFPSHLRDARPGEQVRFAHYHRPETIANTPALMQRFVELVASHPRLLPVLVRDAQFRQLFRPTLSAPALGRQGARQLAEWARPARQRVLHLTNGALSRMEARVRSSRLPRIGPSTKVHGLPSDATRYLAALVEQNFPTRALPPDVAGCASGPLRHDPHLRFVVSVMNPYRWLVAFYRQQRDQRRSSAASLEQFVRAALSDRRLSRAWNATTPVDAWNHAVGAWSGAARLDNVRLVRKEDLEGDFEATLRDLAVLYGRAPRVPLGHVATPVDSGPAAEDFARDFSASTREFLATRLDVALMAKLGYPLLS